MYNCPRFATLMLSTVRLTAALALLTVPVLAQKKIEFHNGKEVADHEVIVRLRNVDNASKANISLNVDADNVRQLGSQSALQVIHSRSKNTTTLINELSKRSDVLYVEPNYIIHASATPNDPNFSSLWGLANTGQTIGGQAGTVGSDVSARLAWDISTGGTANVVGVIDTGLDYNHPDLQANVWSAPTAFTITVGGLSITCPAGSHGFNAINRTCDPLDDNDHGTHVSGTIGAVGNNAAGVAGLNWNTRIMGLKFLDSTGSGTLSDAINAVDFAIQVKSFFASTGTPANVRVLSNSWGGAGFTQSLLDAINRANTADMLFVVAAGNSSSNIDTSPTYPASYNAPNLIAVAATDNRDALASFSNWGAVGVALGAPGVYITSTIRNGAYGTMSGTSMATPHVSGAAMLVLSKCSLTTASLRSTLLSNIDPVASLTNSVSTKGRLNMNKAIRSCSVAPPPPPAASTTATFVKTDTATQGSWKGVYGADGYQLVSDGTKNTTYSTFGVSGQSSYTWSASTTDVRGLQKAAASDRIMAAWYTFSSFDIDVNVIDAQQHKISLYIGDYDGGANGRAERIDVIDYSTGTVLDTRSLSSFYSGLYVSWNVTGHVILRVTNTSPVNAVVSAIFFDPASSAPVPSSAATVSFVKSDTATQGGWKTLYGHDGYNVINDGSSYPSYAQLTPVGASSYTWTSSTTDVRALQHVTASGRIAAAYYSSSQFSLDLNLTDAGQHQIAVYCLDYDGTTRGQTVEIVDYTTGTVLDSRSLASFNSGVYLVYNIHGHVLIRTTRTAGPNAVLSGVFLDPPGFVPVANSALFVKNDGTTQGTWKGVYGVAGFNVIGTTAAYPAFATVTPAAQSFWQYAASTTTLSALQKPNPATDRIAAIWYSGTQFTVDVNLTDGNTHQVALYCLDYDSSGRSQTVDVLDATSGSVLSTKTVSSFVNGQYLVWNIKGHVTFRFTMLTGYNATLAGIFFEP
jgi:subtilisin family serine protease